MHSIKSSISTVIFVVLAPTASAQTPKIDSLEALLAKHQQADTAKVNLLNDLAYEMCLHYPQKAQAYVKKSSELASQLDYPKGKASSLWITGNLLLRSDKDAALNYLQEALKMGEKAGDKVVQCNSLISIASIIRQTSEIKVSDDIYEKALQLALETNNKHLILKVRLSSARNRTRSGEHLEATKQLQEVIRLSKEIGDNYLLARAYADLSVIYHIQGNYPIALEYRLSSLEINEKRNDYVGVFDNLSNISSIQIQQNDFEAALKTIEKAQQWAMQKGDSMRISICFNCLGGIYGHMGSSDAIGYFQKSLSLSKFNKPEVNIYNLLSIGKIHMNAGVFESALMCFNEALALAQKADLKRVLGTVYEQIGILHFKQKKYTSAKKYTQKTLLLAQQTQATSLQRECYKLLSDIYAATGNFKDAYTQHIQYKALFDSLLNEKGTRKIALLESSYEFAKEREVYELEKSGRELRISNQRQTILSLIAISLLVFSLAIVIFWTGRLRKKVLQLEIETMNREIETNQKIMAVAKLKLIQNSERDAHHIQQLEDIRKNVMEGSDAILGSLISNYKLHVHQSNWEELEILFTKVNTSFWNTLNELYPTLTPNERKLCVFLKLNMSNKDIALITFQSEEALKKSRLRLRKKFDLDRSTNLIAFIQNL